MGLFIHRHLWCLVYQVYKEGRAEPEFRKIEALHQRCLNAERMKDEASLTLQSTQNKLKKLEMESVLLSSYLPHVSQPHKPGKLPQSAH